MNESQRKPLADQLARIFAGRMNQPWAIKRDALASAFADMQNVPSAEFEIEDFAPATGGAYQIVNGVAIIPISGIMLKDAPRILVKLGYCTDTAMVTHLVSRAAVDPEVGSILLAIESPGGILYGVQELGDTVYNARALKPVHAHVEDLCASAAYWVASQASSISANRTAFIGSIGVYMVHDDINRLLLNYGIDTRVIASALHKGGDESGSTITESELAETRRLVNDTTEEFTAAVAKGCNMTPEAVAAVATGQVWIARAAQSMGLLDSIENSVDALERVSVGTGTPGRVAAQASPSQGGDEMFQNLLGKKGASPRAQDEVPPVETPVEDEAQTGALQVTLAPQEAVDAGAMFVVDEGEPQASGTTVEGLAAGEHGVSYTPAEGFVTPEAETVTIVADTTVAIEKTYEAAAEEAPATPAPAEAAMTAAQALELAKTVGAEKALAAQAAGKSVEQALTEHAVELKAQLALKTKAIEESEALGSKEAVAVVAADAKPTGKSDGKQTRDDYVDRAAAGLRFRDKK